MNNQPQRNGRPAPQRPPQRPPQHRPPEQRPPQRPPQPPIRRPMPPKKRRDPDDYLIWFLILAVVLLVAVIVTYIIIRVADKPEEPNTDTPSESSNIQAGVVDPPQNETTALEWAVVPSDLKAFVPKFTDDTATVSASDIYSDHAIVVDLSTGEILASRLSSERVYPASLTKIMTVIVACESIKDMKDTFTLTLALVDPLVKAGASRARFALDTPIPMEDLIYGAILPSGGDACLALAIKLAGSEEEFVELMNEKAKAIGCNDTHFVNTSGLHHDDHYSTVKDLATMMAYAMNNPFLKKVFSAESFDTKIPDETGAELVLKSIWSGRLYGNESKRAEMFAAKTGYTPEAGQCLASVSRTNDGKNILVVSAEAKSATGAATRLYPFIDAKTLCDKYVK